MKKDETVEQFNERIAQPNSPKVEANISLRDIPEIKIKAGLQIKRKQTVMLRVKPEIVDFFKKDGAGYQARIIEVLAAYVDSQKEND